MTKAQWREEQEIDPSLSKVITLIHTEKLAPYECKKTDPDDLKGLLRQRKDLFLDNGLLYRKPYFQSYKQTSSSVHHAN